MTMIPVRRLAGLSSLLACLYLASCENTKQKTGYEDVVDYTSPTTKLSKEEYPFDEAGNYREDWAARGAGVSGVKDKPTITDAPYVQEPDAPTTPTVAVRSSNASSTPRKTSSASSSSGSSSRSTASTSKPKPKPKPRPKPAATYVKVKSGDTLYSYSKRYGVSVAAIKAANGLSSDLIIDGKSLKIPGKR